jgi:hypothetical protein
MKKSKARQQLDIIQDMRGKIKSIRDDARGQDWTALNDQLGLCLESLTTIERTVVHEEYLDGRLDFKPED